MTGSCHTTRRRQAFHMAIQVGQEKEEGEQNFGVYGWKSKYCSVCLTSPKFLRARDQGHRRCGRVQHQGDQVGPTVIFVNCNIYNSICLSYVCQRHLYIFFEIDSYLE